MTRTRTAVVVVLIAAFAVAGGVLIHANQSHGGQARTITVTVTDGKSMNPNQWTANLNDTVTVNITSNIDGEVHLHGYDIPFECKAGQVLTKTFKADKSGSFDIEWESTSTPLGSLQVS
jgi:FtsP/CotA-like multicopper oxidase with cupredoxin domain